ncbi:MAG: DUF5050 domain-containing protein [Lachnospiraceae bacterium]|nr:DUF5050 domain-containing protein [Lachnospiraceae bacterium]
MKKRTYIIAGVIAAIVLTILIALGILSEHIIMNPAGTVGNTAGNLNNAGLFCEYNGTVYFSNSFDGGSLYSMNPDETNFQKLNDVNARNILAGGEYLYYLRTGTSTDTGMGSLRSVNSFNRCKLNGSNTVGLTRDVVVCGQLVDNYLYLLTAGQEHPEFYKLKIDNSDKQLLADYEINPASVQNGIIYYNGTMTNHYLYGLDTSSDASSEIWHGNLWNPIVEGDYVYYMDVEHNYRLCRYSLSQDVVEVLTNDRVDCFNVGYGYIYYQKNDANPGLVCMRMDGTDVSVIAEGIYTNINITSQYVYFKEFGDEAILYHSYLGSNSYSSFQAAVEAAIAD